MPDEPLPDATPGAEEMAPPAPGDAVSTRRREFAPPKPPKEFAPPNAEDVAPSWTRWVMAAVAAVLAIVGAVVCVAAVYGAGASFGPGGWAAIYDVAQGTRVLSLLLLTAATFLVFAAMVGTIGIVLGPAINRWGGLVVALLSAWAIASGSLAYMRWRDVHEPPERRRASPPPVATLRAAVAWQAPDA